MVRVPEANQTAAEQGKAELRILNFRTTMSEFQKLKQSNAPNNIPLLLHVVLALNIHNAQSC